MAQKHSITGTICPVCRSSDAVVLIEMSQVPVHCNVLCSTYNEAVNAPKGDIRLEFCWTCAHTYNSVFQPDLVHYTPHYENSLHFSPRFQAYAESLAARLVDKYDLHGKSIIEIGAGQGEFLAMLCDGNQNKGFGFDPSYDENRAAGKACSDVSFIQDFYSEAHATYKADFICCRQALEHIQYPLDFLQQVRRTIGDSPEAIVFFEVPNSLYTLRDLGIWDIIYEHCSYFSAGSLAHVFQEAGFEVQTVYPAFGDQFLCIEALPACEISPQETQAVHDADQLSNLISAFRSSYQDKVKTWDDHLRQFSADNATVVVWGAGSKGVTFLNIINSSEQVDYVVDINPHKQGMYIARTGQRIVSPDFLREYQPDVVLLMNPNYHDEVRARLRELRVETAIFTV